MFPDVGLLSTTPKPDEVQSGKVVRKSAVWISRRNHEANLAGKMTSWQEQRALPNDDDVTLALQKAVLDWNNGACLRRGNARGAALGVGEL